MSSTNAPIASGLPYPIVTVNGVTPGDLADFTADDPFFVISVSGDHITIAGNGTLQDEGTVRFHEKDPDSAKDVRVWCVTQTEHGFTADAVSPAAHH